MVLYQNSGTPNLRLNTTSTGRFLTVTAVHLDVHRVAADCSAEFMGSVSLQSPSAAIHLPEEQSSQLVFKFLTYGNGERLTTYTTLLRPRTGHSYAATVTYDEGFYDVELREIGPNGAQGRKIEHRSLSDCHRS
jgi:hypothetical protein